MNRAQALHQLQELGRFGRPMRLAADGWKKPWQTLVAIVLSARTRDETTIAVAERLFKKYSSVALLASASESEVAAIVRPVNFFRTKTRSVLGCVRELRDHFQGRPPSHLETLVTLPGVGRKTANVFLAQYGEQAIGVDTHVAHISYELGWTKYREPRKIEKDLEKLFPRNQWRTVNSICVRFGKTHTSRRRKDELLSTLRSLVP